MDKKIRYTLLIILMALCTNSHAQRPMPKDTAHKPVKVEVFDKADYFDDGKGAKSKHPLFNMLKFNPLLIFNGELPIFYERKISDNISAELGIGVTLKNYMFDLSHLASSNNSDITGQSNTTLGYVVRSEIRYFPQGKKYWPEGSYFAVGIRYKVHNYNWKIDYNDSFGSSNTKELIGKRKFVDFVLMYGHQEEWDYGLYFDYYLGAGIRSKAIDDPVIVANNYMPPILVTSISTVPLFTMGVKVGFAF